jgi:nitronate monooxygenase
VATPEDLVTKLEISHPIVQGPFGGGLSTTKLASVVSNRGGLGSYGAHILEPAQIGPLVGELRALTTSPFALNLWVSDEDAGGRDVDLATFERVLAIVRPYLRELGIDEPSYPPPAFHPRFDEQIDALLEARPPVFSFVFGIPAPPVLAACRERHIVTVGAATSVDEAVALEAAGVDVIVATGFEAGGHRPSFLRRAEDSLMGTFALTQLVSRRVKVPVIAAGGVVDGRGVRAAITLGASGAQLGTAFLACEESGAASLHRDALFGSGAERTVLTRAFSGRLARGIENRWTREMQTRLAELPPFPMQSWLASLLKAPALAASRVDVVSLWSGQIAPNLKHRNAERLMDSLLEEISA